MNEDFKAGYKDALHHTLINTKELINEINEAEVWGLLVLRDWLEEEIKNMEDEE